MEKADVQEAIAGLDTLPTLPAVLGHILSVAADPNASALELAEVLSRDQSLGATLLKLVNSAYYGFYRQIDSLSQAVVILGFIEVRKIAMAATAFRSLGKGDPAQKRSQLWLHSLATALLAETCVKEFKLPIEGSFEAGLLHDIGKVVLDLLFPEQYRAAAAWAQEHACSIGEAETQFFSLDHCQVGGLLAEHWNLPERVAQALRFHHSPEQLQESSVALPDLAALADYISYTIDLGEGGNPVPPIFPEASAKRLQVSNTAALNLGLTFQTREAGLNEFLSILEQG